MSTTTAGILFLASLIVALAAVHVPLGDYMYRVYTSDKHSRGRARHLPADRRRPEGGTDLGRLRPQRAGVLGRSASCSCSSSSCVQGKLPLHLNDPATPMTPALAWNTAVSFVTNTNWQAYSGESTQGHLVQMAGLAVQNFVSAAVGMAVAIALVRGFARRHTGELGNFWVDLVRGTHPNPAADRGRSPRSSWSPAARSRTSTCTTRSSTPSPAASRPSPADRWPARRPSRNSAPTAAASTTPTPRTRSRTPPRGPTGSRSSCCW